MNSKFEHLKLQILPGEFKYVLFKEEIQMKEALPKLFSLTPETEPFFLFQSGADKSAIMPSYLEVVGEKTQDGWAIIRIVGDMPFGTVQGLISTITTSLQKKGGGACVISTYLTDFFLIKKNNLSTSIRTLQSEGWVFIE